MPPVVATTSAGRFASGVFSSTGCKPLFTGCGRKKMTVGDSVAQPAGLYLHLSLRATNGGVSVAAQKPHFFGGSKWLILFATNSMF
jgi:hypothetical protein